ncbi:MAG TPA: hypothetical protein VMX74_02635 [Pirellulales bacterium]|nr:hypothetical protein [Pirellulales bacterium]
MSDGAEASMPDFDAQRAFLKKPDYFQRFTVSGTSQPLARSGLADDSLLLVIQRGAVRAALLRDQMLYHHAAQGTLDGEPFLITF